MNKEMIFLKTLEDLEVKSRSNDWYDIVMSVGLVYKLLWGEQPLISKVDTKKQTITFNVGILTLGRTKDLKYASLEDALDGSGDFPFAQTKVVTKDELYKHEIMFVDGQVFTIQDLVKFIRNKQGSVHFDDKKLSNEDELLKELQETFFTGGINAGLRLMRALARVVCVGLEPLKGDLET